MGSWNLVKIILCEGVQKTFHIQRFSHFAKTLLGIRFCKHVCYTFDIFLTKIKVFATNDPIDIYMVWCTPCFTLMCFSQVCDFDTKKATSTEKHMVSWTVGFPQELRKIWCLREVQKIVLFDVFEGPGPVPRLCQAPEGSCSNLSWGPKLQPKPQNTKVRKFAGKGQSKREGGGHPKWSRSASPASPPWI